MEVNIVSELTRRVRQGVFQLVGVARELDRESVPCTGARDIEMLYTGGRTAMAINVPELEIIPAEQRQSVMEEAVRTVNATHGKMSTVPHFVGCALAAAIIVPLAMTDKGPLVAVLAGLPAYVLSLLVGIALWRRSMVRELRIVVGRIVAARALERGRCP